MRRLVRASPGNLLHEPDAVTEFYPNLTWPMSVLKVVEQDSVHPAETIDHPLLVFAE